MEVVFLQTHVRTCTYSPTYIVHTQTTHAHTVCRNPGLGSKVLTRWPPRHAGAWLVLTGYHDITVPRHATMLFSAKDLRVPWHSISWYNSTLTSWTMARQNHNSSLSLPHAAITPWYYVQHKEAKTKKNNTTTVLFFIRYHDTSIPVYECFSMSLTTRYHRERLPFSTKLRLARMAPLHHVSKWWDIITVPY